MIVRVISDLHLDVNKGIPFAISDDVFTVLCGDVSGNPHTTKSWIKDNIKRGIFVAGNHLVYNDLGLDVDSLKQILADGSAEENHVTFLDVSVGCFHKKVEDVHFIGSTLYTDYEYTESGEFTEESMYESMEYSKTAMNDFRYGIIDLDGKPKKLTPNDYRRWFLATKELFSREISKIEKEEANPKVFVVTHHAPSPICISDGYKGSLLNPSFTSNLEDFISEHPCIKVWACGHMHSPFVGEVNGCKILLNPRGYVRYGEGSGFMPNLTIDTDTWEVSNKLDTSNQ